ncbi:tetratricopeptide repeat protein, partial [bacterium]|nr:tetratricopeptide repeat protein [bacterium]
MKHFFRIPLSKSAPLLFLSVLLFGLNGCMYFNAFYNTKHNFAEGERERERTTDLKAKPQQYSKAVDAGAKLVELYPDSKYISETLFIMGQSYYWLEEHFKAKRKFEELLANYPDSPNTLEARLWLGRTMVAMKKRQEATSVLRSLIADTDDPELTSGAYFALAELYYVDEQYRKAEEGFLEITNSTAKDETIGEAWYRAGESAFKEQRWQRAVNHLSHAVEFELTKAMQFQASLLYGESLLKSGDIENAAEIFRKLLKDKRYYEEHGIVRVLLAVVEAKLGEDEEPIEELVRVSEEYKRSPEASRAHYERAMLLLNYDERREEAKEALDAARVAKAGSEYAEKADSLLTVIERVDELGKTRRYTLARMDLTEKFIADPIQPSDTSLFFKASYYDSLAIDTLKLSPLWEQAWYDSIAEPEKPEEIEMEDDEGADSLATLKEDSLSSGEVVDIDAMNPLERIRFLRDQELRRTNPELFEKEIPEEEVVVAEDSTDGSIAIDSTVVGPQVAKLDEISRPDGGAADSLSIAKGDSAIAVEKESVDSGAIDSLKSTDGIDETALIPDTSAVSDNESDANPDTVQIDSLETGEILDQVIIPEDIDSDSLAIDELAVVTTDSSYIENVIPGELIVENEFEEPSIQVDSSKVVGTVDTNSVRIDSSNTPELEMVQTVNDSTVTTDEEIVIADSSEGETETLAISDTTSVKEAAEMSDNSAIPDSLHISENEQNEDTLA